MRRLGVGLFAALLAACASGPPAPPEGRGGAWGYLRLVPREGLPARSPGSASYGDRRLADVSLVDYQRPGFAVVYDVAGTTAAAAAASPLRLAIRSGAVGPRIEPAHAALSAGGAIEVVNETAEPHVVSCPAAQIVRRLEPGGSVAIEADAPGEWPVFLLDAPPEQALVFAAPGAWAVTGETGRFEFADLAPGRHRLAAWHHRFPPASLEVEVPAGQVVRVDLELRVGAPAPETGVAP